MCKRVRTITKSQDMERCVAEQWSRWRGGRDGFPWFYVWIVGKFSVSSEIREPRVERTTMFC